MKIKLTAILILICTVLTAQEKDSLTGREDNVEYKVIFDGENLYLTLRSEFKETMQSMLHRGYTIYFDVKGKKKKNVSIQYPLNAGRPEKGSKPERGERREKDKNSEQKGPDIAKMIENAPKKANYTYFDSSRDFNLDINDLGITMNYNYEDANQGPILVYHLKIPASKISEDKVDLTKLSIGIVSNKLAQNQQQPSVSMGGRQGGGQGRPSGGRGGGRGGAGRGNSGVPPQRTATTENKIDFWFKLYPKKNK